MEKKVEYVREHYSKEVRKSLVEGRKVGQEKVDGYTLRRKKQRVWTLNRSPHGNKTAREQFGRQVWQRRVKRTKEDGLIRRKQTRESKNQYVRGKEIQTQTLDNEREKNK
jgi:ribosomal protein S10